MVEAWVLKVLLLPYGVEFDTYQNLYYNDPSYDHLAISKNGSALEYPFSTHHFQICNAWATM